MVSNIVKRMFAWRKDERGVVVLTVALSSVGLMGFVAMAVDVGMIYETRRQLQVGLDGAALAGAWELPSDPANAVAKGSEYAAYNGIPSTEITARTIMTIFNPNDALQFTARRRVDLTFARILGLDVADVDASATAIVAQVPPVGVWPWGVPASQADEGYVVLKYGAIGDRGGPGNFGPLNLPPGEGATSYLSYIRNGWDDPGGAMPPYAPPNPYSWWVDPQTGNMVGPTRVGVDYLLDMSVQYDKPAWILADPDNYDPDNPPAGFKPHIDGYRIGLIPLISDASWDAATGKSRPVEITGFAAFYLDGRFDQGGHMYVTGVFLANAKGFGKALIGAPLEGLIGARLWR
ncbi:MAG: hypothetical protein HYX92_18395 [Chloroflexi bacterium]|nr:hypothetical protein [Chloroflexota bacterium]